MVRRVEFAAGAAAGVLTIISLLYVLFVPLVCVAYDKQGNCPSKTYRTIAQSGFPAWFWVLVICLTLLLGSGSAAAIAESRYGLQQYAPVLWVGAVLSLAACALTGGLGPFYFVAVVALGAAAYASILPRIRARNSMAPPDEPSGPSGPSRPSA
jgi:hypothetical protein